MERPVDCVLLPREMSSEWREIVSQPARGVRVSRVDINARRRCRCRNIWASIGTQEQRVVVEKAVEVEGVVDFKSGVGSSGVNAAAPGCAKASAVC